MDPLGASPPTIKLAIFHGIEPAFATTKIRFSKSLLLETFK